MNDTTNRTTERPRACGCAMMGVGIPLLAVGLLAAIFLINNRPPQIKVPTPKMPIVNGYYDFVKAGKLLSAPGFNGPLSDASRKPEQWTVAELQAFEKVNTQALALVRVGLAKPYRYPPVRSSDAMFPELATLRETARTLVGVAMYYERIGDLRKAADTHLDCIEMGVTLPRGGVAITGLVGIAIEAIGSSRFEPLLQKLSAKDLAHMAERLDRIEKRRTPFADVILEEGYFSTADYVRVFNSPQRLRTAWEFAEIYGICDRPSTRVNAMLEGTRLAFANKTAMLHGNLEYFKALAKEQRGPYTGDSQVPVPHNPIAEIMGDLLVIRGRTAFTVVESELKIVRTEVALLRYHADHGGYPRRLADLAPKYVKSVPADPFGRGKPLRYRSLNGGKSYLLYSIGRDMLDDHGKVDHQTYANTDNGDIVAGHLRK